MRKTFKQRIRDWLNTDDSFALETTAVSREDSGFVTDESIRFDITSARGGIIVNVRNYDPKTDRNHYTVHVIHDDQNVAESIAQIVSLEMLKH
jgi:hypothetical protein